MQQNKAVPINAMSSNMAMSAKPTVRTSYSLNELKLVKVAIVRHYIQRTNSSVQPFIREVNDPYSITTIVNVVGTYYDKLFRDIIPNTIQLTPEAYSGASKVATGKNAEAQIAKPSSQRSALFSSDEDTEEDRRSRKTDKVIASKAEPARKRKRSTPERERSMSREEGRPGPSTYEHYGKRKSARPRSGSPRSRRFRSSSSPSPPQDKSSDRYRHSSERSNDRRADLVYLTCMFVYMAIFNLIILSIFITSRSC